MERSKADVDFDAVMEAEMAWAVAQKRSLGVAFGSREFKMRFKIIGPGGQHALLPLPGWTNQSEQQRVTTAMANVARQVCAQAAIVVSDAMTIDVEGFCRHFNLPVPETQEDDAAWDRERVRIMKGFDFYMGNLPLGTWREGLLVAIKGPRVLMHWTRHYRIEGAEYVFDPIVVRSGKGVEINMLPPWWQ